MCRLVFSVCFEPAAAYLTGAESLDRVRATDAPHRPTQEKALADSLIPRSELCAVMGQKGGRSGHQGDQQAAA